MKTNKTKNNDANAFEIGDDLEITKTTRRAAGAGTWVTGYIAGHKFEALVFPEHAECEDYELGESRISKLWIQKRGQYASLTTVANFDRGWDIQPKNKAAWAIVDFLAAGLADTIYHK